MKYEFSKNYLLVLLTLIATVFTSCRSDKEPTDHASPNIILVMVDDMGYGDLGCYGQKVIRTPNIDQLAANGIRFTDFYSGSPVCAPARSVLMTGMHTGHTTVRGNFGKGGVTGLAGGEGRVPLRDEDVTMAEVLKEAGYYTGMTGKWGLGEPGTTGLPNDQGFDEWFGHLNQRRAHNHYPEYIWLNKEKYPIPENADDKEGSHTHPMFTEFALDFIQRQAGKDQPFFMYIPYLIPHSRFQVPEINPLYKDQDWTRQEKVYASMISLIDTDIGRMVALLKKNNILENTLVLLTSDNGAANRYDNLFESSGNLRGRKRDVYEGGIRVPLIVSMPGTVPGGKVNSSVGSFADLLPTFADIAGQSIPHGVDGKSLKDVFLNNKDLTDERSLYWEFHEQGGKQAVRTGDWKGLRLDVHEKGFHENIELYNLKRDPSETDNVADQHPAVVLKIMEIMAEEHVASNPFPFKFEMATGN